MSNEIHLDGDTGDTYDGYIFNVAGQVAVTAGTSFENWVAADTYDITLTEVGVSGHFVGDFPSNIAAGVYGIGARKRAGTNPANSDEKVGPATDFDWDGTNEISRSVIDAVVDAIKLKTDYLPSVTAGVATGLMLTNHITADSGVVESNITEFLGTVMAEGSGETGQIADSFEAFFNISGSVGTAHTVSQIYTGLLAQALAISTVGSNVGDVKTVTGAIPDSGAMTSIAQASAVSSLNDFDYENEDVNLAATGLDNISAAEVSGVATTFPQKVVQLWQRFFHKSTSTSDAIKTYKADSTTVNTTQTAEYDGTTKSAGKAS